MIFAYMRLSTTEDKQKNSFAVQKKEILKHFKILDENFYQETLSGATELKNRPILIDLLTKAQKGDKVVVQKLDRLSRDTIQAGVIRYELQKKGVELVTVENPRSDPIGKLLDNLLLAFAEFEKETTRARIKKTLQHKKDEKFRISRYAQFGYEFYLDDKTQKYKIRENEKEQEIIKLVMERNKKRKRPYQIFKELKKKKIKSRNDKYLDVKMIQRIIKKAILNA